MAFSVEKVLQWIPGRLANQEALGNRLSAIQVRRMAPLSGSLEQDLCFFFSKEYQHEVPSARPGILITGEPFVEPLAKSGLPLWNSTAIIACADPYGAMALLSSHFASIQSSVSHLPGARASAVREVHPSAIISPSARLGEGVKIGPFCVVEEHAEIGNGTVLYPGCFVGPHARVGADSVLFPRVTLYEAVILGNRARIHAGAVIGSDGFGYAPELSQGKVVNHRKIYHLGRVVIGDDVEIGSNCTIDRGTLGDTVIGSKSKLDNDVHIGHNTQIGEGAIFCGNSSTAGGAKVGNFVYMGGMSGVSNRITIGDHAKVAAMTGVIRDVNPDTAVAGMPPRDIQDFFRLNVLFNRMLKEKKRPGRAEAPKE